MALELIRYREEFKPDIARLLCEFWSCPEDVEAQFSWLQEGNPFTEAPLVYLAQLDGRVVGMRGFYGARWEIAGGQAEFDAPCGNMFVVESAARGKGVAHFIMEGALTDLAARGYRYVLSLSARPIPYFSQLRDGWRPVMSYDILHRETRRMRLRRGLRERAPFVRRVWRKLRHHGPAGPRAIIEQPGLAFRTLDAALPTTLDGGDLRIAHHLEPLELADLCNAAPAGGSIRHVRTPAYFAWRYRAPLKVYRFLTWSDGRDRGYLVLEAGRGATGTAGIVDWDATCPAVLARLFRVVCVFGGFDTLWTWQAGLPDELTDPLADEGFSPSNESMGVTGYAPGMMVRALADGTRDGAWKIHGLGVDDPGNWSLRPIYSI